MGNNESKSQSLSLQALGEHGEQGSCHYLARRDLGSQVDSRTGEVFSPAGQSLRCPMPRDISVARSSTGLCGAQLSQQCSGTCLCYTLKMVYSTLLGLFDKCLCTHDAMCGISPGAYGCYMAVLLDSLAGKCGMSPGAYLWVVLLCRHGCSDHTGRYFRCVSLPDMSVLT